MSFSPTGSRIYVQGLPDPAPAGVAAFRFYRSTAQPGSVFTYAGPYYRCGEIAVGAGIFTDFMSDATLVAQPGPPTSNTAQALTGRVTISGIQLGPAGITARKLYRSRLSDSTYRLVGMIGDNTTTSIVDTTPDAGLGAAPPSSNTAGAEYRQVQVSNIAAGPSPTTQRKLYRTAVGGAQLKLVATLANNTTTAYLDAIADGSLGANAPTGDTSGINQISGQVPAGSPTMIVANVGAFRAAGGWAIIGNGDQVIRYTSIAAGALQGIPASGIGAIVAAVAYNSTVTAAPMLIGIPASGARSIQSALTDGDEVYLVVQCDDAARQADLAADVGGDGVKEDWVQDRRLSVTEARARGQATLQLHPLDDASIGYTCRDLRTASGKTIQVALAPPTDVSGTFRIQDVTISNFRPHPNQYPTFAVKASNRLFTFEDFLRRMETTE
jgi:hypothetical protein